MEKIKTAVVLHGLGANGIDTLFANLSDYWDLEKYDITYLLAVDPDNPQFWEEKVLNNGIKVVHITDLDGKKLLKWPFELSKALKKYGPFDAVHVNMDMLNGINLLVAKNNKIPVRICHSHTTDNNNNNGNAIKRTLKNMYLSVMKKLMKKYSTKRIACSDLAGEYFFGKDNYEVLLNGIDIDKFTKVKNSERTSSLNFATVGRITHPKNPIFIADIVNELYKRNNKIKFSWVGSGAMEEEVKQYVNTLPCKECIDFLGSTDKVENVLSNCRYFLLPSRFEGFGLVLAEAQAAGLDCFASDVVPDIVNCGKCKFISLDKTAAEWADEIFEYIKQDVHSEVDKNLLGRFDIKNMAKNLQELYQGKS